MDYSTRAYTQETPVWLWDAFTDGGPAADGYDRYSERITRLIAADVLANCPDQLEGQEREFAEELAAGVDFDV